MEENATKTQKRLMLMEQMNAIKKELGLDNGKDAVVRKFKERLAAMMLNPEIETIITDEIGKLESLETYQGEYSVTRTYLEWLLDLPWNKKS